MFSLPLFAKSIIRPWYRRLCLFPYMWRRKHNPGSAGGVGCLPLVSSCPMWLFAARLVPRSVLRLVLRTVLLACLVCPSCLIGSSAPHGFRCLPHPLVFLIGSSSRLPASYRSAPRPIDKRSGAKPQSTAGGGGEWLTAAAWLLAYPCFSRSHVSIASVPYPALLASLPPCPITPDEKKRAGDEEHGKTRGKRDGTHGGTEQAMSRAKRCLYSAIVSSRLSSRFSSRHSSRHSPCPLLAHLISSSSSRLVPRLVFSRLVPLLVLVALLFLSHRLIGSSGTTPQRHMMSGEQDETAPQGKRR